MHTNRLSPLTHQITTAPDRQGINYPTSTIARSEERPLAPAMIHNRASSLDNKRVVATLGGEPSHTHILVLLNTTSTQDHYRVEPLSG
jgi:hypothetical protein